MPSIFELFGYHVNDWTPEALRARREARCPFTEAQCDGGGNRYLSSLRVSEHPELADFLGDGRSEIPCGVCSLLMREGDDPWIVCPRRLLSFGRGEDRSVAQDHIKRSLIQRLGFAAAPSINVWSEVRLHYQSEAPSGSKLFNYTFDYILLPGSAENGQRLEAGDVANPGVVEIMTASTSGGNRRTRTTIQAACVDALMRREHRAPGINYRQVWARMVSQLIAKSEAALEWGGHAIWVLQDVLVQYIRSTTGLDPLSFQAQEPSEVNMLVLSYPSQYGPEEGPIHLSLSGFLAGPISAMQQATEGAAFQDIVRAAVCPPVSELHRALSRHAPGGRIRLS